jgi:hypothetical protein
MPDHARGATRALTLLALAPLLVSAGCAKQQAPKVPLAQMTAGAAADTPGANPHLAMSADAHTALDSGNAQYRAGKYAAALKSYRTAADLAPLNPAPFFGIYMAAEKLGDKKLADSAGAEIKRRETSGTEMLTDSQLQNLHAKMPAKGKK